MFILFLWIMPCCCNDVERIGFTETMSIALRANTYTHSHTHSLGVGGSGGNLHAITAYSWLIWLALLNRPEWQLEKSRGCFNITHAHPDTHTHTPTHACARLHSPCSVCPQANHNKAYCFKQASCVHLLVWHCAICLVQLLIVYNNIVSSMDLFITCIIMTYNNMHAYTCDRHE